MEEDRLPQLPNELIKNICLFTPNVFAARVLSVDIRNASEIEIMQNCLVPITPNEIEKYLSLKPVVIWNFILTDKWFQCTSFRNDWPPPPEFEYAHFITIWLGIGNDNYTYGPTESFPARYESDRLIITGDEPGNYDLRTIYNILAHRHVEGDSFAKKAILSTINNYRQSMIPKCFLLWACVNYEVLKLPEKSIQPPHGLPIMPMKLRFDSKLDLQIDFMYNTLIEIIAAMPGKLSLTKMDHNKLYLELI